MQRLDPDTTLIIYEYLSIEEISLLIYAKDELEIERSSIEKLKDDIEKEIKRIKEFHRTTTAKKNKEKQIAEEQMKKSLEQMKTSPDEDSWSDEDETQDIWPDFD
jgi:hypothetical protein